ncbi:hypothetical protein Tco_1074840 [Tanacetum coccineum]
MQERQTHSYMGNFSKGNDHIARQCTQPMKVHNSAWFKEKMLLAQVQNAGIALNCDEVPTAQASFMANLSSYSSDVLSEVSHFKTYQNDMYNQSLQAMPYFEQTPVDAYPDNEITSDSNIILYSQYLLETQQAVVQDTNSFAQQDSMILSVIEKMSEQMINHLTNWDKDNMETNSESLTAELERYKE